MLHVLPGRCSRLWPLAGLLLAGCTALGGIISDLGTERPPLPLDSAGISSDARLDSSGMIAGSFVGEGTSRRVHLLSSDPALIADLVRRFRPERDRRSDPLQWLAGRRTFAINPDPVADSALLQQIMLVGSPDGHTRVRLRTILLHSESCRRGEPQAELIVEKARDRGPSLRGPVIGSFRAPDEHWPVSDSYRREEPPEPAPGLVDTLLARTSQTLDSLLAQRLRRRDLPLTGSGTRVVVNTLDDEDAADVIPFRLDNGQVRYAVSLRERRTTARGADALAAIVMIWDGTLRWRQVVFRPTLLEYRRRGLSGAYDDRTAPFFWRRLEAVSGFAFRRDYLWMEQVDASSGQVRWVILEPRSNTLVAAANVEDGC